MSTAIDLMRERFLQSGDNADLPIVDAHHHFWDLQRNYHPWLRDLPRIPFRYGDYEAICRDFLPEDYFALDAPHHVVKTVMMEGEWDPRDPLGEARWATTLNARCGFPNAMAGQVWLDRDDVADVLREYRSMPLRAQRAAQAHGGAAQRAYGNVCRVWVNALRPMARWVCAARCQRLDVRTSGAMVALH